MGVVDEVIKRLVSEPERAWRVDADRYGLKSGRSPNRDGSVARSMIVDSAVRSLRPRRDGLRNAVGSTGAGTENRADVPAESSHLASGSAGLLAGFTVIRRGPSGSQPGAPDSQQMAARAIHTKPEIRRYALGGGELGRVGVTPLELSTYARTSAGVHGRLIAAIEDYVAEGLTRHTAALIRQGIAPR